MLLEEYKMSGPATGPLSDRLQTLAVKSPMEIVAINQGNVEQLEKKVMALVNVVMTR